MTTRRQLLHEAYSALEVRSSSPRLDADLLLAHVESAERWQVLTESDAEVAPEGVARFRSLIHRRLSGEPVAYLLSHKEFFGLSFYVDSRVLIPRPESELLVQSACAYVLRGDINAPVVVDLGTGSGCLLCSVLHTLRGQGVRVEGIGVDISQDALEVAKRNAEALGVCEDIKFFQGEWCAPLERRAIQADVIVSNPPYVATAEFVSPEVRWEPQCAVFSPDGGLRDVAMLLRTTAKRLKPGGLFLCEVGAGKRATLRARFSSEPDLLSEWSEWSFLGDDSGEDKFSVLRLIAR